ncbi:MAG: hypothetical protein R2787_07115 [Saprospiraceae bacterium]
MVVPWHFGNANPGPLDPVCLDALSTESLFLGGMGGIMMNILLAISTYFFWKQTAAGPLRQWLLFFGISHLLEVATYLTISNILTDVRHDLCPGIRTAAAYLSSWRAC